MQNLLILLSLFSLLVIAMAGYTCALSKGYRVQTAIIWAAVSSLTMALPVLSFWKKIGEGRTWRWSKPLLIVGNLLSISILCLFAVYWKTLSEDARSPQCAELGTSNQIHQQLDAGFKQQGYEITRMSGVVERSRKTTSIECRVNLLLNGQSFMPLDYSIDWSREKHQVILRKPGNK